MSAAPGPSSAPRAPFAGRRLWFAGIGGAGLSGYAVVAHAWGAEVAGWDRGETPYLAHVRAAGIPVTVAPQPPAPPAGAEVVVSTAFADRIAGNSRAALLAELVAAQPSIVVAGAHGKTTTAAMIAFCLDRLGRDPGFLIGGEVPQLGGNARAGSGWLVVEGDESDRTIAALLPRIAVVTNVDLDHHSEFGSRAEVAALFERWLNAVPEVVRGERLAPAAVPLAVPGEHNRRNAACALAALELAGVARGEAEAALAQFTGVGRRFEPRGEAGGVAVVDDYARNPAKVRAVVDAARERTDGRVLVLFQPHLYSRTRHAARELGAALARADAVVVTEVYAAREEPVPGVTGKLVVDAVSEARPGMHVGWASTVADGAALVAAAARPGDLVLTVGAGDVDRAVPAILDRLRRR
ncbi:MAG: UDP-N-acetylmuramate--L-alanine ligase [Thermoleophilia bacterium]|nr:UDP-N-acetylmuramate--L-alanine ligase [Thermoleophilia bacterium]